MRASLIDLIKRMTVRGANVNSDQSVAWHAHREAEALSDASPISELAQYLQSESKQDSRKAAYFILGKLGEKFPASKWAAPLVAQVKKESNKCILVKLLDALGISKPTDLDLTLSIFFSQTKGGWFVIPQFSLKRAKSPKIEEMILHVLETTSDPNDLCSLPSNAQ